MSLLPSQFKKIAVLAARAADIKKAEEILLLDLRRVDSSITDYCLILSANSFAHIRGLREFIEESLESLGLSPVHCEGAKENYWVILDYGGLLVHIFHAEHRQFYSLERLWEKAKEVPWEPPLKKTKRKKSRHD